MAMTANYISLLRIDIVDNAAFEHSHPCSSCLELIIQFNQQVSFMNIIQQIKWLFCYPKDISWAAWG